jgi:hypothetical protein
MHHRDGGPDPTELVSTVQQVIHRPTGACHTNKKYPSQPVMGGGGLSFRSESGILYRSVASPRRVTLRRKASD